MAITRSPSTYPSAWIDIQYHASNTFLPLAGGQHFSKLNLSNVYLQMEVEVIRDGLVDRGVMSITEEEAGALGGGTDGTPSEASEDGKEEGAPCTSFASPWFGPLSPEGAAKLRMKLARLEMEQKEREGIRQREFELEITYPASAAGVVPGPRSGVVRSLRDNKNI